MAAELHVGDIGTEIQALILDQAETIVDLSGATVLQYILYKPSKTIVESRSRCEPDGITPLQAARQGQNKEIIEYLISIGAKD